MIWYALYGIKCIKFTGGMLWNNVPISLINILIMSCLKEHVAGQTVDVG